MNTNRYIRIKPLDKNVEDIVLKIEELPLFLLKQPENVLYEVEVIVLTDAEYSDLEEKEAF